MKKQQIENVFFTGETDTDTVDVLLFKMQDIKNGKKIPRLILHCWGGNTTPGFYLHDQIKLHFPELVIIGSGAIGSMGINVFLAAKKENRFITENTHFFMHEVGYFPSRKERKNFSNKKRVSFSDKEFKKLPRHVRQSLSIERGWSNDMILAETTLSEKKLIKLERKESYLSNKKIIEYGFASKIISSLEEI